MDVLAMPLAVGMRYSGAVGIDGKDNGYRYWIVATACVSCVVRLVDQRGKPGSSGGSHMCRSWALLCTG
jgi:hypothetical protein